MMLRRNCQRAGSKSARTMQTVASRLRRSLVILPPAFNQRPEMRVEKRGGQKQRAQRDKSGDPVDSPQLPDIEQIQLDDDESNQAEAGDPVDGSTRGHA